MTDNLIDFNNFTKKVIINPIVPLQILNIYCRNSMNVQATLLGKVYASHIEIVEIVPVGLCEPGRVTFLLIKIKTIDFV
jgi:hypothetical protein